MVASVTAQEVFSLAMRTSRPELRKLGLVGSGQILEFPHERVWLLLGIQKSASGAPGRIRFTINLAAVRKEKWAAMLENGAKYPARPNPNTIYGKSVWSARVGSLMPGGQDYWWTVTSESDPARLAQVIVSTVAEYCLPAMLAERDELAGGE
ncbi:DUF4304 domain-containing protein [Streptacidiphilus sp. N1-10]|uniref:DUF4304 domain-containing protein n=1 Tax=Streptacidiphilus jeojiensis TaxID=3229225 RepID=A0ABV6XIW0_9ACTN